jgi:peptidoglycan/LPS O-acetylase OafA/YrhL
VLLACVAAFSGQLALHYVTGSFQSENNVGLGLFSLWLVGFALFFLLRPMPSRRLGWTVVLLTSMAAYLAYTRPTQEYDFVGYGLLSVGFGALLCLVSSVKPPTPAVQRVIHFSAGYSFSLYLVHHTVMMFVFVTTNLRGAAVAVATIVVSNVLAIGLASIGEDHHKSVARWLRLKVKGWHHTLA